MEKNYAVIINPHSGRKKGAEVWRKLRPLFQNKGIDTHEFISTHTGHPYEIVSRLNLSIYDAIVVLGGDGTMHEVVNGIMDREDKLTKPIGLISCGTGNSFMHDLEGVNPIKAAEIILAGHTIFIDLARITMPGLQLHAFNILGWGLTVTINNLAEKWRKLGGQRYNIAALAEILKNPKWQVKITLDGEVLEGEYAFFLACNTVYSGNGMRVAPNAVLNDGLMDVIILKEASRWRLIKLFAKIFSGKHIYDPLITYRQVSSFSIHPVENSVLNIDGQVTGHTPAVVNMVREALEVFYPLGKS
jgi:YegS/Rv2252/BmrU family lipid kinase